MLDIVAYIVFKLADISTQMCLGYNGKYQVFSLCDFSIGILHKMLYLCRFISSMQWQRITFKIK